MDDRILPGARRVQILQVLHEHGPLPLRTLGRLIQPTMSERRLQDAVKRLYKKGWVIRKYSSAPNNSGHYYQNSQRKDSRRLIAKLLNLNSDLLIQPHFRGQELQHSEVCAVWSDWFRRKFHSAVVIRDFQFDQNPLVQKLLMTEQQTWELKPDFVVLLPASDGKVAVSVAVEIERTRKTKKRLVRKLGKLASGTLFDGVIYLCDKDALSDNLEHVYSSKVRASAMRIKHYGANYFLFGRTCSSVKTNDLELTNADGQGIKLKDWISFLSSQPLRMRRDAQLASAAEGR